MVPRTCRRVRCKHFDEITNTERNVYTVRNLQSIRRSPPASNITVGNKNFCFNHRLRSKTTQIIEYIYIFLRQSSIQYITLLRTSILLLKKFLVVHFRFRFVGRMSDYVTTLCMWQHFGWIMWQHFLFFYFYHILCLVWKNT